MDQALETLAETNLYSNMKIYLDISNQRLTFVQEIAERAMKQWEMRVNQDIKI
jgi:hypothetical protein